MLRNNAFGDHLSPDGSGRHTGIMLLHVPDVFLTGIIKGAAFAGIGTRATACFSSAVIIGCDLLISDGASIRSDIMPEEENYVGGIKSVFDVARICINWRCQSAKQLAERSKGDVSVRRSERSRSFQKR